jgi:branched-chain amino acid transport system permease protein
MDYFLQQLINGITLGAIYGLIALGYTMVYGIVGMINFAHGEIYMIAAFIGFLAFLLLASLGVTSVIVTLILVLIISMVFTSVYGFAVERVAYRPLRNAPKLAPLISAIGMSIFLQNYVQLTQGARVKSLPPVFTQNFHLTDSLTISTVQLLILGTTALLLLGFSYLINKTPLGRAQRACEQDRKMAALVGVDVDKTISLTFVLGAALAAVAGVMVILYYGVLDFYMGFLAGMKAFVAAVLGGIGSLSGAMLGGLLIGLIESFWAAYMGGDYKNVAVFAVLMLVLVVRPNGLLGRKQVEKV